MQFSYNIEKRNSRVDENYSKRGENYANFVIFEQRNASILGTIIVSVFLLLKDVVDFVKMVGPPNILLDMKTTWSQQGQ